MEFLLEIPQTIGALINWAVGAFIMSLVTVVLTGFGFHKAKEKLKKVFNGKHR